MIYFPEQIPHVVFEQQDLIRKITIETIETAVSIGVIPQFVTNQLPNSFKCPLFVRIFKKGKLGGEMGRIFHLKSFIEDLTSAVAGAVLQDVRFPPITRTEKKDLQLRIYFITKSEDFSPGKAIYLKYAYYSSILFPWESSDNVEEALNLACKKAGILSPCWKGKEAFFQFLDTKEISFSI